MRQLKEEDRDAGGSKKRDACNCAQSKTPSRSFACRRRLSSGQPRGKHAANSEGDRNKETWSKQEVVRRHHHPNNSNADGKVSRTEDWKTTVLGQEAVTVGGATVNAWKVEVQRKFRPGSADQGFRNRTYWFDPARRIWVKYTEVFHGERRTADRPHRIC